MHTLFRTLLLALCVSNGQIAHATPLADATFIAQRGLDKGIGETVPHLLKMYFVSAYSRPLSDKAVQIIDAERFAALVPDDVIAPYLTRYVSFTAKNYVSIFTAKQLVEIAQYLREDDSATLSSVLSAIYEGQTKSALDRVRASNQLPDTEGTGLEGLGELALHMTALAETLKTEGGGAFVQSFAVAAAFIGAAMEVSRDIKAIRQGIDNPVTIAAIEADGILKFVNRVQRQALLRELAATTQNGGILFQTPPTKGGALN